MNCFAKFIAARITSISHALRGLGVAIRTEGNAKVHLAATILVVILGFALDISAGEWLAIIGAIALVWIAELMNTALEGLCDIVSPEYSEKVKHAKDTAAAAVLVAATAATIIGAVVFLPYF
ncbi:MAG: diacylglycerol kinase family protein [Rhodobacteraceae bacterium]|nr:diacylglycerol kinase family protein [Paracoccaceae bacterium]